MPAIGTAVACSVVCYAMYELAEYTAGKINDQRMHKDDLEDKQEEKNKEDWSKCGYEHVRPNGSKTNQIHYWENIHTGDRHDFKFKDNPN